MVDAVTSSVSSTSSTSTAATGANSLAKDFNTFLLLLTTQLQYQDPLSPLETEEFTSQLVGFANVEQSISQTALLEKLVGQNNGSSLLAASGVVGKNVEVFGNVVKVPAGGGEVSKKLVYAHSRDVQDTKITIYNAAGNPVYSTSGKNAAGKHEFVWDGKDNNGNLVSPGSYTVKVEELSFGAEEYTPLATNLVAKVKEVLLVNDQIYYNFGDFSVPESDILGISEASDANNT